MDKNSLFYLGKAFKMHNYKGALVIGIPKININFDAIHFLFVDINACFVPFHVKNIKIRNSKSIIVEFDELNIPRNVEALIGYDFYIFKKFLPDNSENLPQLYDLINYEVTDIEQGYIGTVYEIVDIPGNTLLSVLSDNKKIFIPAVKNIIIEINHNCRKILVQTPSGLLDL